MRAEGADEKRQLGQIRGLIPMRGALTEIFEEYSLDYRAVPLSRSSTTWMRKLLPFWGQGGNHFILDIKPCAAYSA